MGLSSFGDGSWIRGNADCFNDTATYAGGDDLEHRRDPAFGEHIQRMQDTARFASASAQQQPQQQRRQSERTHVYDSGVPDMQVNLTLS